MDRIAEVALIERCPGQCIEVRYIGLIARGDGSYFCVERFIDAGLKYIEVCWRERHANHLHLHPVLLAVTEQVG